LPSTTNLWVGVADPPPGLEAQLKDIVTRCRGKGAEYADVRFMILRREIYQVKDGSVHRQDIDTNRGFGVRVLLDGYWGFAATPGLSEVNIEQAVGNAVAMAKAARLTSGDPVEIRPMPAQRGTYATSVEIDPSSVSPEAKVGLLMEADEAMGSVEGVKSRHGRLEFYYIDKWFANSEGSMIQQSIVESGGGIQALAVGGGDAQLRAYPELMGDEAQAGWEFVQSLDLPGNATRVAEEAVALLDAPEVPAGEFDVIISGSQLALQVHESCGHPSELDRVMGIEADVAGTSFLTLDRLGERRYGSEHVTLTADATIPGALGSFGWDDEGTPAQERYLVRDGLHVGYLTSRQYNVDPENLSGGNARASDWAKPPIVRMTNINLLPGSGSLQDLIADTKHGYLFDGQKTWSIDDRRLNFAFGVQAAWEIRDGKLGRLHKNGSYTGITPEVWGSCDAVTGPEEWRVWGVTGCGKGAPMQNLHVGHGTAPARFRGLKVGVKR